MAFSESAPLVYLQDDAFVVAVGEPLALAEIQRVVVAEHDAVYAEALRLVAAQVFDDAAIELARSGEGTLAGLRDRPADFVLLGLGFEDLDGLDVLAAINQEHLARRVLVVSSRRDERTLQLLRRARFDGLFDPVTEPAERLGAALRQVAAGEGFLSEALCRHMVERRQLGVLVPRLSPAELQVFCVIGDGSDDAEAAARLALRVATVRTHRRNLMRKLGIATSAKLVREAVRLGVVRILPDGRVVRAGFEQLSAERQKAVRQAT